MIKIGNAQAVAVLFEHRDHFRAGGLLNIINVVYDSLLLDDKSGVLIETTIVIALFVKDLVAHDVTSLSVYRLVRRFFKLTSYQHQNDFKIVVIIRLKWGRTSAL